MNEVYRGVAAAFFGAIPASYLSKTWYNEKTDFWRYEIAYFVVFLAMYLLASYLTRNRFPQNSLKH